MNHAYSVLKFPFFLLILVSCNGPGNDDPAKSAVARYKSSFLSQKELKYYLPENLSFEDSTRFAKLYVEQWLKQQIVADEAYSNLKNLEEKVEFKVRDYRAKLIALEYYNYLFKTQMDSVIDDTLLTGIYNKTINKYISLEKYYSYLYTASEVAEPSAKDWIMLKRPGDEILYKTWAEKNAYKFKTDTLWKTSASLDSLSHEFDYNFKSIFPSSTPLILKAKSNNGKTYNITFRMRNIRTEGQFIPLDIVKPTIESEILSERQKKLVERKEQELLQKSYSNNDISHYKIK